MKYQVSFVIADPRLLDVKILPFSHAAHPGRVQIVAIFQIEFSIPLTGNLTADFSPVYEHLLMHASTTVFMYLRMHSLCRFTITFNCLDYGSTLISLVVKFW